MDKNLWIMGSIGAFVALMAIAWFLYSANQDAGSMDCAQRSAERVQAGGTPLSCDF